MPQRSRPFSLSPFFFIITDNKDGKIAGVSAQLPFVTLTESVPLAPWLKKGSSGFRRKASSSLAPSVLLWNFLRFDSGGHKHAHVLFLANQQKVVSQEPS